ncbi:hypothetical protein CUR178_06759 [Leishmania enriettii]|uniref:Uncharacterized protein n=1 Tax=Leishmania enriettii TaxID=5663 RepID=A0A836KRC0_LEIEN|nr:hypothetical protein CUR178_06759 [Leishmania enriettii]
MMRLSALSRVARRSTDVTAAATVRRRSRDCKKTTKATLKKRSPSNRVTPRRRRASPASGTGSMSGAAGQRAAAAPSRLITIDVACPSACIGGLDKHCGKTTFVPSAAKLARGGREICADSPDNRAGASPPLPRLPHHPASALPPSAPPLSPPPAPHVDGRRVSVETLQRRIRSLLAQLVLLSPDPLRPSALFARYRSVVDEETASMCAWAAHAVYKYERELGQRGGGAECRAVWRKASGEGDAGERGAEQRAADRKDDKVGHERSSGSGAAAEERVLWNRGRELSQAFRASVVPLVAALCGGGSCGGPETSVAPRLPASHEVDQWIFLSIIFSDAEFRVSPYSGAVSYPTLPSMLMATVDPMRDREVAKLCYALQWGVTAKAAAYAAFHETHDTGGPKYRSSSAGRTQEQQTPARTPTARMEAVTSTSDFVWLNGATGSPKWTTAHAQYLLHSALMSARKSSDGSVTGPGTSTTGSSAGQQLRKAIAAAALLQHTSGHPLVDVMLQASSAAGVVARSGSPSTSKVDVSTSVRGAQPPALGWNEGKRGTDAAVSFATDASEDGLFATMMGDLPIRGLSAGAMHEINRRLIAHLFRKLVAIPISVARLSAVVRWNLSVTHAAHHRSLLYFLLLTAANPMVRRMAEDRRHRRRTNAVCADIWGAEKGDRGETRGGVEDEVRHALARYNPQTFGGLQGVSGSSAEGSTVAALHRAFVADADVTKKCERVANAVMEVMCVRVLPHARPGQRSSAATAPDISAHGVAAAPITSSTFCGYPLRFVEVLPTWRQTPEEVLEYLWRRQDQAQLAGESANWLENNEEPYILVFSLDRGVLDTRLRLVVDRYLDLTDGDAAFTALPRSPASRRVSLHQLGLMTLWAHEYGVEMAAELLMVHLLPRHEEVRLYPPRVSGQEFRGEETQHRTIGITGDGTSINSDYGAWTVEFLPQ